VVDLNPGWANYWGAGYLNKHFGAHESTNVLYVRVQDDCLVPKGFSLRDQDTVTIKSGIVADTPVRSLDDRLHYACLSRSQEFIQDRNA
jgi:hypothetical protein